MPRKYGKDKYINLIPDLEKYFETYIDINDIVNFNDLLSANITVTLHPFRFSIFKGTTLGSVSIFCTYNGHILVNKYTYDINIFNTELSITAIRLFDNDIAVIITETMTKTQRILFVRTRYIF
jgi:hypothetical protein